MDILKKKLAIVPAIAALAAFVWTPIVQGKHFDTFVVDADGMATSDDCDSYEAADFTTIQGAIDAASDTTNLKKRDVILVCPGDYLENVEVDKTVILQGVGGGAVGYAIVDADGSGRPIIITADGVKIDNLKILNAEGGGPASAGVYVDSEGNEISHNWIAHHGDEGIDLNEDGNYVHHNTIEDVKHDCVDVDSGGNDVHHNTMSECGRGIDISKLYASDNDVKHNMITMSVGNDGDGVDGDGIRVQGDNNNIHQNTITDSGESGIDLTCIFHQGGRPIDSYHFNSRSYRAIEQFLRVTVCPIRFYAASGFTFQQILLKP
jgi:hypothetical protein